MGEFSKVMQTRDTTISNSSNPPRVQKRLCKQGKSALLLKSCCAQLFFNLLFLFSFYLFFYSVMYSSSSIVREIAWIVYSIKSKTKMFIRPCLQISTNVNWTNAKKVASTQLEVISAPVLLVINWHQMATTAKVNTWNYLLVGVLLK